MASKKKNGDGSFVLKVWYCKKNFKNVIPRTKK